MNDFYIILAGSLVAASSAILGCFLVLRKMSMIGDAISHAVLPGIVIAFLLSGSRSFFPVMIGAASLGVLTTYFIEWLHKKTKLQQDASIGMSFTFLFAVGVIMINLFAKNVDIDQDCVLHGELAYLPLNTWITESGLNLGPKNLWIIGFAFLVILGFVIRGYKGLFITTFDENYAKSIGISAVFWHYALMSVVSLNTVVSFESVGAILVVAFLVVPPSSAYLLTDNLKRMIAYAVLFGILSAIGGYYLAVWIDSSIAACMSVITGVIFILAFLFSPKYGWLSKKLGKSIEFDKSNFI